MLYGQIKHPSFIKDQGEMSSIINMKANDKSSLRIQCLFLFIPWKENRTIKAKETTVEIKCIMGGEVR